MSDLIARLEKATAPERRLDGDIALVIGWNATDRPGHRWREIYPSRREEWGGNSEAFNNWKVPPYTGSIDAALTLRPDGFQAYVDTGEGTEGAHACVWTDYPHRIMGGARKCATPAIALCIAALRARGITS